MILTFSSCDWFLFLLLLRQCLWQAEKLSEKHGSYAAVEQAFFRGTEECLWGPPPPNSESAAVSWLDNSARTCQPADFAPPANAARGENPMGSVEGSGDFGAAWPASSSLEAGLGRMLAGLDALEDATDLFRLHDELRALNRALEDRARSRAVAA